MEGEEIGLVLARASDLRSRISACAAAARTTSRRRAEEAVKDENYDDDEDEEEGEEVESLVGISDALESLERQLAALQDLQHQQRYERETILSHIDRSRRSLLNKLREYKKGQHQDREAIREAAAFAGDKVERDDDDGGLILPPYSDHVVTSSFALDDLFPLNFVSGSKHYSRNGPAGCDGMDPSSGRGGGGGGRGGGIGSFIGWLARTAVMVVGAVSIAKAAAAGYDPGTGRSNVRLDVVDGGGGLLFGRGAASGGGERRLCPPGKVTVLEDGGGRARCVAKERVEVPFDDAGLGLASPSASYYGLG